MLRRIPKKKPQTRKKLKQETLKKISLEKLPRILLETKKQKNSKISMIKTHTFLEKLAPKSVNSEDFVCQLIHPPHGAAKLSNWSHYYFPWWWEWAKADKKQTKREDERKSSGMKQGERSWDLRGVGVLNERREKKKEQKRSFILYKDNIILMYKRATIIV